MFDAQTLIFSYTFDCFSYLFRLSTTLNNYTHLHLKVATMRKLCSFSAGFLFLTSTSIMATDLTIVTANEPPFQYEVGDGHFGYSMVVMQDALRRAKLDHVKVQFLPWARAYQTARTEPNVLFFSVSKTEERKDHFQWCCKVFDMKYYFYALSSNSNANASSLDSLINDPISVWKDDIKEEFLRSKGFKQLIEVNSDEQSLKLLLNHKVNYIPFNKLSIKFYLSGSGKTYRDVKELFEIKELDTSTYFVFSNGSNIEIMEQFQSAFAETLASDTYKNVGDIYEKVN